MEEIFEKAKKNFLLKEENLSPYATKSSEAIRLQLQEEDIRPAFFHDIDRIIHSLSYIRYIDKTQVYSFKENDHISKRMTHVQLVSKIARTIGRALLLNEDLIEAIALGHDIGHTPLGHLGEAFLNDISKRELGEEFGHNLQSVRDLMVLEKNGEGLNLTVQVLDGIMCHNGEMLENRYVPEPKEKDEFLREYNEGYQSLAKLSKYASMTLEGCVVRVSDIIAYIGRDIEDAINLNLFKREDIPLEIVKVLGCTNREIVNTIILDIIENSMDKPYIELSENVYQALFSLKKFNYEHIYQFSNSKEDTVYYRKGMEKIYQVYLDDILKDNRESIIFKIYLDYQKDAYIQETSPKRMVIDFISGMTDEMFLREVSKYI